MVTSDLWVQGCRNYVSSPLGKLVYVSVCTWGRIGCISWCTSPPESQRIVTDWENNDNAGAMRSASQRSATLSSSLRLTQIVVTAKADSGPIFPTPNGQSTTPQADIWATYLCQLSLWNCRWTSLQRKLRSLMTLTECCPHQLARQKVNHFSLRFAFCRVCSVPDIYRNIYIYSWFIILCPTSCMSFSTNKQKKADKKGRKADERRSQPRKDVKDRMRSRKILEGSL